MTQERRIRGFDGTRLYVAEEGTGPPLIFCDGLGCDGYIWKYLRPKLAQSHRLIFWHYRGHGRSASPVHPYAVGISALRSDLLAVMDAVGVDDAVLVGHSMGVQLVLDLALYDPARVRGLVLLCGGPGRPLDTLHGSKTLGRLFPLMRALMLRWPQTGQKLWQAILSSAWCQLFARSFEVNGQLVARADLQRYFDHLCEMDVRLFVRLLTHLQDHSVVDRLAQVRAPTLIVAGEHDTLTPVALSELMRERIGLAQLLVVPGGSHVAPIEMPDLVLTHVQAFLRHLSPNAPGLL